MSIDKAINEIWHCIVSIRDCVGNKKFVEALQTSINIMRKYQKIQEIIQNTSITDGSNAYAIAFIDIKKVVEDDNA